MRIVPTSETFSRVRTAVAGTEAHLPILASGAVAFAGQMAFASVVLGWPFLGQVLYAAGIELFGYGMARLSARVRREGDKGAVAMASSWLFSVYAGACNYWHSSPSWAPNPTAVGLGVASVAGLAAFYVHEHYAVRRERRKLGVLAPAPYVAATDAPTVEVVKPEPTPAPVAVPSVAVAAAVARPARPVAATSPVSDGPSRTELARIYLDEQHEARRLDDVRGPELQRAVGLGESHARKVLADYRRDVA